MKAVDEDSNLVVVDKSLIRGAKTLSADEVVQKYSMLFMNSSH